MTLIQEVFEEFDLVSDGPGLPRFQQPPRGRNRHGPKQAGGSLAAPGPGGLRAWWSSPFYWRTRAAAEEALGRFEPADESFKRFLGHVIIARQDICDPVCYFYELSLVKYNLGRIAEKTGNPTAAKDHYRKFLDGMTAADPGLPEVADAQKRLSALK
jgi:hypothetical protein